MQSRQRDFHLRKAQRCSSEREASYLRIFSVLILSIKKSGGRTRNRWENTEDKQELKLATKTSGTRKRARGS